MRECPVCRHPGFTLWRTAHATPFVPALCASCGTRVQTDGAIHVVAAVYVEVVLWGGIILAVALHAGWLRLIIPVAALGGTFAVGRYGRLVPATAATARSAWRTLLLTLGFLLVFATAGAMLFGH